MKDLENLSLLPVIKNKHRKVRVHLFVLDMKLFSILLELLSYSSNFIFCSSFVYDYDVLPHHQPQYVCLTLHQIRSFYAFYRHSELFADLHEVRAVVELSEAVVCVHVHSRPIHDPF